MLKTINSRRSVRQWKADPVSDADLRDILEAGMNAPTAGGAKDMDFVVLRGEDVAAYCEINTNVPKGAPVGILVCAVLEREVYPGYYLYGCCAALENMLLAMHAKGLGGVWTAIFPANFPKVAARYGLPERTVPVGFIPFGVPAKPAAESPSRYDPARIHHGTW